jgi:hypothetical protein
LHLVVYRSFSLYACDLQRSDLKCGFCSPSCLLFFFSRVHRLFQDSVILWLFIRVSGFPFRNLISGVVVLRWWESQRSPSPRWLPIDFLLPRISRFRVHQSGPFPHEAAAVSTTILCFQSLVLRFDLCSRAEGIQVSLLLISVFNACRARSGLFFSAR